MFDQFRELVRKLEGHYANYGLTGNGPSLNQVRTEAVKLWYSANCARTGLWGSRWATPGSTRKTLGG